MIKTGTRLRLTALVILICLAAAPAAALGDSPTPSGTTWKVPKAPSLSAGAAILMDWHTGEVLYAKDATRRRDPASTTKVLTALIALERGRLSDRVTISARAARTPGSSMHIRAGEVYSLHDLIHGLMLRSGNDAAVAIAEHMAGSVEAFAEVMNRRAKELGAKDSHFTNPHGLTDPGHFSTAYDLALITRHALENETFRNTVSLRERPLTYEYLHRDVVLHNTNRLLRMMPDADGVKTGTTAAAGACLIASATRDEQKLLAVVLHAGNRWNDSHRLLEWGFGNFHLAYLGRAGDILLHAPVHDGKQLAVPLALAQDLVAVLPRSAPVPKLNVELSPNLAAPVRRGDRVGRVTVTEGTKQPLVVDLTAADDVPRASLLDRVRRLIRSFRYR